MKKTIQQLEAERLKWSKETFIKATPLSSLEKLREEVKEIENEIKNRFSSFSAITKDFEIITEVYADALMCLLDSAGRLGINPDEIFEAFEKKLAKNKLREWKKNTDNTYSHIK